VKLHYTYTERESPGPDGSRYDRHLVGLDVVLGDAVMDLIDSGVDEDAHFWGSGWHEIDDDELEFALNDSSIMLKMSEYIRPLLLDKLREVLAERKAEKARHPEVG